MLLKKYTKLRHHEPVKVNEFTKICPKIFNDFTVVVKQTDLAIEQKISVDDRQQYSLRVLPILNKASVLLMTAIRDLKQDVVAALLINNLKLGYKWILDNPLA